MLRHFGKIIYLTREIVLDRAPDAGIEELRGVGTVKIAIKVGGVVVHFDIAFGRGSHSMKGIR